MSHVHPMPVYHPSGAARREGDPPPPPRREDGGRETEREEGVALAERPKTKKPSLYRVLLHNDDYTTMEFVVEMLTRFFDLTATDATRVMLQVHHLGVGVAGTFTRDEAETRIERVTAEAEAAGFPLLLTMEPE
ncbi:ATP-dependent Clp protease adaptor ClpS [Longimicrobium sp.]|uniref:ATP-dependent Clp protease adaptor ClpS n=1 Tax=Longimicrobium sp. TaxID=2029185 RepID=UPI002C7AA00D|nr:ATP-dependent Clp protease adaptor ClpS [Longimicrobium sp.]HSU14477.1 ATP-dependent Clp protease adaptor ClpS [Longimicrobium sp.]